MFRRPSICWLALAPACAKQITENLARRAFRRPVTADDVAQLMPFYEAGRSGGGTFDQGIEQVVAAILAWLVLSEALTALAIAGGVLVLVGIRIAHGAQRAEDEGNRT